MIYQRTNHPYRADDRIKLSWRKVTNLESLPEDFPRDPFEVLHERRSKIKKASDLILTRAESEKRELTEDEKQAFDHGLEQLDALNEEFQIRAERNTKNPVDLSNRDFLPNSAAGTSNKNIQVNASNPREYRSVFRKETETGGFESFGEFLLAVANGRADKRLDEVRSVWAEGTGAAGGFAVPTGFYEGIYNTVLENSVVMQRAKPYSLEYGNLTIPAFDDLDHATDGLYGGMVPQWLGEGSAATAVRGKLRTVNLKAHKLGLYMNMSLEVVMDSPILEQEVTSKLTESLNFYVDYYLLRGNGVAQPKGVLNDSALIKITRNTSSDVKWADIVNMYSRMYPPCLKKAVWVIAPSVTPKLINMVDAGNHLIYVGNPSYNGTIAAGVPNTLLGLPVFVSEKMPSLGTEGDILLADFSNYAYGTSPTIIMEKSNAPFWDEGLLSYRAIIRLDSEGLWSKAISPLNGDSDLSWCVTLAA